LAHKSGAKIFRRLRPVDSSETYIGDAFRRQTCPSPRRPPPDSGFSCYVGTMNSKDIVARLKENEAALRARGVAHAALFGSRARGDNRPGSDIDIMIEIDPEAHIGVFDYAGLKDYIAEFFDAPVDVVSREGLKSYIRPAATADAIYAF
jgi:uncharacterized protein